MIYLKPGTLQNGSLTTDSMEDREALMMNAAICIIASVKGEPEDVEFALKGDKAGMAFLAGKYAGEIVNVFHDIKEQFNWKE